MPDKAYEVFVSALKTRYLEHGYAIPVLENHNPAGTYKICLEADDIMRLQYISTAHNDAMTSLCN